MAALSQDDVAGYFAWLAGQHVRAPLALARLHHRFAVERATLRQRTAQHEDHVQEAAAAANAILNELAHDEFDSFLLAAREVSDRLEQLISSRPSFPSPALAETCKDIGVCLAAHPPEPSEPASAHLADLRALLKTSPPDEPMSAANWLWLRSVCPGF